MGYAAAKWVWFSTLDSFEAYDARLIKLMAIDCKVVLRCRGDYSVI